RVVRRRCLLWPRWCSGRGWGGRGSRCATSRRSCGRAGGSSSSPPCVVEWVGGGGRVGVTVDDEDVAAVGCLVGAVCVGVDVLLNIEALHVLVEGADVLLWRLSNGHVIGSCIRKGQR